LDELLTKGDGKIKEAVTKPVASTGSLVFPGVNDEKKVDIKNLEHKDSLKQTLLDDLQFLKDGVQAGMAKSESVENKSMDTNKNESNPDRTVDEDTNKTDQDLQALANTNSGSPTLNQFKEEILPKTKEERMKALQDKIKSLNKGVSVGGKTNISTSGLDPYRI
jgi:hypothetical protein